MNDKEFEDVCFLFAMHGLLLNGDFHEDEIPHKALRLAKKMSTVRGLADLEAPDQGIVGIRKRGAKK